MSPPLPKTARPRCSRRCAIALCSLSPHALHQRAAWRAARWQARPWFPFAAVTFALLAVIGNLLNLVSLLTVRAVIGFKGVKSPALLPIAKGTTYTLYIGVWISFQSTISGITRAGDVIDRLSSDIGTISPIQTIFSVISLVTTFLLTPIQLAQIVQSYGILYKGLLPIVSINQARRSPVHRYPCTHTTADSLQQRACATGWVAQMGSHLNAAVQQSMTLSSLALFGFTMMANAKAAILDEPTVFGEPSALASDLAYSRRLAYGGACAQVFCTHLSTAFRRSECSLRSLSGASRRSRPKSIR